MANKFDIDSSADTHLLNETFHVFSKSPGSPTTTLGGARLKSGHTTTATDVWADEIPAFFNAATQAKFDLFQSKAVKDDLCLFDGKVYQHNGTAFVSLGTTDEVLVDGKTFSKNNKAVVKYHKGRTAMNLTADNNNGDGSNNYTAKIYNAATGSTTFVPQFISAMDKMVDGIPSLAYDAVVSDSTGVLAEGLTADNDYICNSYAGVIQFNKARSQGTVTVSAWEYIGEKLTASLTELSKKVESVTATAGECVQAVTNTATTAGLSVSTKEITVEGQTDPVTVKALDITVANVSAQGVVATDADKQKLVTATGAQNIAGKVVSDATLAAGKEIATATGDDTSKLVTVDDVTTYVSILEQKVNDHLLDAAGKLEITVLADKLPKKPFFEDEVAYVNSYGFEWEKLSNNIYTNKFEVKVAQSVSGLNEFKSHTTGTVLTPSSLAAQTCKLVIYSIDDAKQLTEVAVSQPNTFDASTSIYAFKFDNQISLTSGVRYRICFRTVDGTNALHCLPVIVNSSIQGADVTKHETPTRYIIGETEDDLWGCWNTGAGQLNGVQQVVYGPKVSVSGLTPTPDEDGSTLSGEKGKIYLIPNEGTENQNVYDEFVWTNNTWEKIGTTEVDLSDYVTNSSLTTTLASYVTTTDYNTKIGELEDAIPSDYVKTVTVGSTTTSGETTLTIKDGRDTVYANDLWGTTVSIDNNTITVQGGPIDATDWANYYSSNKKITLSPKGSSTTYSVSDNKLKNNSGTVLANIKTDELVNGSNMFSYTSLTSFSGDLSSLVNGSYMFNSTSLTSFSGDLSSLVNGSSMFSSTSLTSFSGDLSSLVNGSYMFSYTSLTSFSGDLSSLVNGSSMFNNTSLTSFSGDLSSLVNGSSMFYHSTSLTSFSGDLSSLVNGSSMFNSTSLDVESVELICDVLPNYNTDNGGQPLQTCTWDGKKYTYTDWTSGIYYYPIIKISYDGDSMSSGNTDGIDRTFGTESISQSNVKSIRITWKDISILSADDRTAITKLFGDTATEKGWTFITNTELGGTLSPNTVMTTDGTIQYYVLAKKDEATEDDATHIDANGKLWKFDTAEAIIGPNVVYWSMFATVEDALTEWELTPYVKPTEEETEA